MHKHKCPDCGCVWEHKDRGWDFDEGFDFASHEARHKCPRCGTRTTRKYFGDKSVTVLNDSISNIIRRREPPYSETAAIMRMDRED